MVFKKILGTYESRLQKIKTNKKRCAKLNSL